MNRLHVPASQISGDRVTVRELMSLGVGRMTYLCWCDADGKVIDDGTVARLGTEHYRLTSAAPGTCTSPNFASL